MNTAKAKKFFREMSEKEMLEYLTAKMLEGGKNGNRTKV
jgi:hypothetical protein